MIDIEPHENVFNPWLRERKSAALNTDKKENQIFIIYEEIHSGAVAKSYIRKGS
jgi:hypothetical protein